MAIIAITQHLGTRGELLGRTLADRLGYRFMNVQDTIDEASKTYKITPELLVIVDERARISGSGSRPIRRGSSQSSRPCCSSTWRRTGWW